VVLWNTYFLIPNQGTTLLKSQYLHGVGSDGILRVSEVSASIASDAEGSMAEFAVSDALNNQAEGGRPENLRPWPRGVSGCPGGRHGLRRRLEAEQGAALASHLGRPLKTPETIMVKALVAAMMAKPENAAEGLKKANTLNRITKALYGHPKPKEWNAGGPSLDDIAAEIDAAKQHEAAS
jgi:hypothetical protein